MSDPMHEGRRKCEIGRLDSQKNEILPYARGYKFQVIKMATWSVRKIAIII